MLQRTMVKILLLSLVPLSKVDFRVGMKFKMFTDGKTIVKQCFVISMKICGFVEHFKKQDI